VVLVKLTIQEKPKRTIL